MAESTVYLTSSAPAGAMTFYQACLGVQVTIMQTVGESAIAGQMPAEMHEQIMHSTLVGDGVMLLASDMMRGLPVVGNTISLILQFHSAEEIERVFSCSV